MSIEGVSERFKFLPVFSPNKNPHFQASSSEFQSSTNQLGHTLFPLLMRHVESWYKCISTPPVLGKKKSETMAIFFLRDVTSEPVCTPEAIELELDAREDMAEFESQSMVPLRKGLISSRNAPPPYCRQLLNFSTPSTLLGIILRKVRFLCYMCST